MPNMEWDQSGKKVYETGVDHGALYLLNPTTGEYDYGVPWNGLTTVTETPSGAESNKSYADNQVYVNLQSAEEFGGTIEAFTYPEEFESCDGTRELADGVTIGQQARTTFGFSYRTKVANDLNAEAGYKLHLVYGAIASPSEKAYATVNDSPEPTAFSWEFSTTPVASTGQFKPTALIVIDSTKADLGFLEAVEELLYGEGAVDPQLPLPSVIAGLLGSVTEVNLSGANAPSYNSGTHVLTLPAVTGVTWKVNDVTKTAGAQPALTSGQTAEVTAHLASGYEHGPSSDDDWVFTY